MTLPVLVHPCLSDFLYFLPQRASNHFALVHHRQASLDGALCAGTHLAEADLTRASLAGATLTKANLSSANLTDAVPPSHPH